MIPDRYKDTQITIDANDDAYRLPATPDVLEHQLQIIADALALATTEMEKIYLKDATTKYSALAELARKMGIDGYAKIESQATILGRRIEREIALSQIDSRGGDRRSAEFQQRPRSKTKNRGYSKTTITNWRYIHTTIPDDTFADICAERAEHVRVLLQKDLKAIADKIRKANEPPKEKQEDEPTGVEDVPAEETEYGNDVTEIEKLELENQQLKEEIQDLRMEIQAWQNDARWDDEERINQMNILNRTCNTQETTIWNLEATSGELRKKLSGAVGINKKHEKTIATLKEATARCTCGANESDASQ